MLRASSPASVIFLWPLLAAACDRPRPVDPGPIVEPALPPHIVPHAPAPFVARRLEPLSEDVARVAPPPEAVPLVIQMRGVSHSIALDETEAHATLIGPPLPPGARLLPVRDLPEIDLGVSVTAWALVSPDGRRAHLADEVEYPLERAATLPGEPARTGAAALAATLALRYLRTCPTSRHECLLFGPPAEVAAAVDPVAPPGGWFLDREPALGAGRPAVRPEALSGAPGLEVAPLPAGPDEEPSLRVYLRRGRRAIPVFDMPPGESFEGGVVVHEGRTIVWLRDVDAVRLRVAVLDEAGERSDVLGARATSYEPVFCGVVFTSTRPLPVLVGDRVAVALGWSQMNEALLFDQPGRRGRVVPAHAPETSDGEGSDGSDLPPLWTLSPNGRLEPVRTGAGRP